jgi:hypothetical protein
MRGLLLASVLLAGCAYRVRMTVQPENASVLMPDGVTRGLPVDIPVPGNPFGAAEVQITAPGYRTVDVRLPWHRFAFRRVRQVRVLLVEDHGPSGTWTR